MDGRFKELKEMFEKLEGRFDHLERRFDQLERENQRRFDQLEENQNWINLRFSALREVISPAPRYYSSAGAIDPWPHYGPAGDGCNSKHIIRCSKSTI